MTRAADRDPAPGGWRQLGRQGVLYFVGESASKGLTYLLLIALARLSSVADFGAVNLFIAIVGPTALVAGLGLPDGVVRFYYRRESVARMLGAALAMLAAGSLLVAASLALLRHPADRLFHIPVSLTLLCAAAAPAMALRLMWLATLRARGRAGLFAAARIAEPLLSVAILAAWYFATGRLDLWSILAAYVGGTVLVALCGLVALLRAASPPRRTAPARELLAYSLPLIFHGLAMSGLASFDQILINRFLGLEATGSFAFAYRFGMAMFLVSFGTAAAWGPFVLSELSAADKRTDLGPIAWRVFGFLALLAPLLSLLLPVVAGWVGGERYSGSLRLIPLIVYGYLWMSLYALAVPFLGYQNRTVALASASSIALVFNIVTNYLLIPTWGLPAAALTTVASYALLFLLVWRQLGETAAEVRLGRLASVALAAAPLCAVAWLLF